MVAVLTLGLIVFFLYTGLEVSAGQWEVSYVRGQLGLSASAAGLAAFGYWGALTAVRIGLALPAKPVPAHTVIGSGLLMAIAASGLIWWQPGTVAVVLAFVVLGAALAGVFPALIAVTPQRIGAQRARHAIAWQVGAAAAGGSAVSAVIGLLIDATSLAVLGPALVVLALLLFFANLALARLAPIRASETGSQVEGIPRWAAKRSKTGTGSVATTASGVWPDGLWKVTRSSACPVTSTKWPPRPGGSFQGRRISGCTEAITRLPWPSSAASLAGSRSVITSARSPCLSRAYSAKGR